MKRLVGIILLAAMLLPLAAVPVAADDGFDSVRLKWYEYLTGGADESAQTYVSNKIASLNSSAYYQWQRMNKEEGREYLFSELQDAEKSSQVTSVYNLLEIMAQAYATAGGVLYKNENLKKDLISALDWMHQNRYNKNVSEFDNWWDWEIGTPTKLNNIMVLLYDELDEATVKEYVSVIKYFAPDPKVCAQQMYPFESTAANRVSMCMVAALCGVLVKEGAAVEEASNALAPVFEYVTEGDGFYEDGSFIQHGRNPYNGGYGLGLLSSITDMIFLLGDSRWQVSESERVYEWFYNSFLPFTYDGLMMDTVTGRNLSRDYNQTWCAYTLFSSVIMLAENAQDKEKQQLRSIAAAWLAKDKLGVLYTQPCVYILKRINVLNGVTLCVSSPWHRQFASMDRVVHKRDKYTFSLAMNSERVYNYESILNENLKGWHTSDGMTFVYTNDTQYADGYWATVNSQRLPGTTVDSRNLQLAEGAATLSDYSQVGGVSLADMYGAACMESSPAGMAVHSKKSWFMFDDEIVALGADISSTDSYPVETVIDNRMVQTDDILTVDEEKRWAHIGDMGYYIQDGGLQTLIETRSGAWSEINYSCSSKLLSRRYAALSLDHGTKPEKDSYVYALLPGKTAAQTEEYARTPAFEVIANNENVQSVKHTELGIESAVFWSDGGRSAGSITSSGRAAVMLREKNNRLEVSVSDPTQKNAGKLIIELDKQAADLIECDSNIEVLSVYPKIRIAVNVNNMRGKSSQAAFYTTLSPWEEGFIIDKNIDLRLQPSGETLIDGVMLFRNWAAGTTVYSDDGLDNICIKNAVASEYKNHFLLPETAVAEDGITSVEVVFKVYAEDSEKADDVSAQLMLKLSGGVGFMPLCGNLIGNSREQRLRIIINTINSELSVDLNGERIKSVKTGTPTTSDLADVRLYTVAKPASGSFTDGTDTLAAAVIWEIDSITVSHTDRSLIFVESCGVNKEGEGLMFNASVRNERAQAEESVLYAAAYSGGRLTGVSKIPVKVNSGETEKLNGRLAFGDECRIYLWSGSMIPYDSHELVISD